MELPRRFIELPSIKHSDAFECLVETDVVRGVPQEIRMKAFRSLRGSELE
jgi:hypothetical protein